MTEQIKIVFVLVARHHSWELTRLFFFTEKEGMFYFGTDNSAIDKEDIDGMQEQRKIQKLKEPLFIDKTEELRIGGHAAEVWVCNSKTNKVMRKVGILSNISS
jgi:hypothetical protein